VGYPGEHQSVIDQALWDAVQQRIVQNAVERGSGRNFREASLLAGIIRDGLGRRMTPSHSVKRGRRYRYYITHASDLRDGEPPAWRIPAHDLEAAAVTRLASWLKDRRGIRGVVATDDATALERALANATQAAVQLADSYHRRRLIALLVENIRLEEGQIILGLAGEPLRHLLGCSLTEQLPTLVAPAGRVRRGKEVKLVVAGSDAADRRLVGLLAEARIAHAEVLSQPGRTVRQVAAATGQCSYRLSRLFRLAHLSPEIVDMILTGAQPTSLSPRKLLATPLPIEWDAQKAVLGFC
jgi:site-specific DNA recombinase